MSWLAASLNRFVPDLFVESARRCKCLILCSELQTIGQACSTAWNKKVNHVASLGSMPPHTGCVDQEWSFSLGCVTWTEWSFALLWMVAARPHVS